MNDTITKLDQAEESIGINDEWEELMGKDLVMKVLPMQQDDEKKKPNNGDKEEEEGAVCNIGDAAIVSFTGHVVKDRNQEINKQNQFVSSNKWIVIVGDKDVIPALEMGIRFMQEKQTALVYSDAKYAYGPAWRDNNNGSTAATMPPNSNILYRIHLDKIISSTSNEFSSPDFILQIADYKKQIGNDVYQYEWADGMGKARSLHLYQGAANLISNHAHVFFPEEQNDNEQSTDSSLLLQDRATRILLDSLNNISAVYLKSKEYSKAKDAAIQVLKRQPSNIKALLRAARAALRDPTSSFDECHEAVCAAEQEIAKHADESLAADVKRVRAELERRKRHYQQKSKAIMTKLGQGLVKQQEKKLSMPISNDTKREPSIGKEHEDKATVDKEEKTSSSGGLWQKLLDRKGQTPLLFWQLLIPLLFVLVVWTMSGTK